jgi:rhomboid protease GluP
VPLESYTYVKETFLSRKPRQENFIVGLIAVGLLLLVSSIHWSSFLGLAEFLPATRADVFNRHEYWRLFTSLGVHADPRHLLSNSLGFGLFAYLLFDYFGFWIFPVAIVLLGALTSGLALMTYDPELRLVGASGMVYVMVGFWLVQYLLIERRLTLPNRIMRCLGFSLAALMPSSFEQAVSYRTHGIGFLVGLCFGLIYFMAHRRWLRSHEVEATEVIEPLEDEKQTASGPTFH